MADDAKTLASEDFVDRRLNAAIGGKEFLSIDPATGQFMIPIGKTQSRQRYMRLSVVNYGGTWVPDLDQKQYVRNADGSFTEVE